MIYLYAFLFSGTICLLAELVYQFTKLTPGHITTILVIGGCVLEGSGLYSYLHDTFKCGISTLIINFGALITKGVVELFDNKGFIFSFEGAFLYTSGIIAFTICLSLILSFIPKWRIK